MLSAGAFAPVLSSSATKRRAGRLSFSSRSMARALCIPDAAGQNWTLFGCPTGYKPLATPVNGQTYLLGKDVDVPFHQITPTFIDLNNLFPIQNMGIFGTIPVQDVLVVVFLIVMFGIGFLSGSST